MAAAIYRWSILMIRSFPYAVQDSASSTLPLLTPSIYYERTHHPRRYERDLCSS